MTKADTELFSVEVDDDVLVFLPTSYAVDTCYRLAARWFRKNVDELTVRRVRVRGGYLEYGKPIPPSYVVASGKYR